MKTLPNGINAFFSYDSANRLSSLEYIKGRDTMAKFTYERDSIGNITKAVEDGIFFSSTTPTPTPTNAPTSTPTPTTNPTATPTPTNTPTLTPTPTLGLTATPTPTPTNSPTATPTPTVTPTPTPGQNGTDLVITSITTSPANPVKYQSFTISTTVKNQGTVGISNKILKLGFYYDLSQAPTYTTSMNASFSPAFTLAPGASQTVNYPGGFFSTSGAHNIRALIDQGQAQAETDENNNASQPYNFNIAYTNLLDRFLAAIGWENIVNLFNPQTSYAASAPYINTYSYDPLGRLLTASQSAANKIFEYSYDTTGNRLTSEINDVVNNYTYNSDNQLTANDSTNYTYDKRGNQKTNNTKTFTYNFENMLTQFVNSGTTTQNTYDGKNNRLSQKVGSVTTQFVNDVSGDLAKVLVARNTSNNTYNYFVQGQETISEGGAATNTRQYYIYDGMGNVRFITDSNGNKIQALSYDPYGNPLSTNGGNVFQYKGEQTDQDGMYFMRARY